MRRSPLSLAVLSLLVVPSASSAAQPADDAPGCADHPLFTRMTGMAIHSCKAADFDAVVMPVGKKEKETVEGKSVRIRYALPAGLTPPTPVAIGRNHQQAIAQIGGSTLWQDARYTTLRVSRGGKDIWASVDTAWGRGYVLTVVEKQAMVQEVKASAELFKAGLATAGHVEVPGIFFDTGKAELGPQSDAAVAQIAALLKADPALKVYVVGHTDTVSGLESNLTLSRQRAEAVVRALVTTHGIPAAAMVARGVGPLAPVASNATEDGRARNRRVELVGGRAWRQRPPAQERRARVRGMTLAELVSQRKWQEVSVTIGASTVDFVIFPWDEVREREEDGKSNVWEYFIGFDGPAFEKVESGEWTPLGAGNMYAGALKYDGGFQESGHQGMLFATPAGGLVYFNLNDGKAPVALTTTLADLAT